VDVIRELESYGVEVDVHDPWVDPHVAQLEYGLELIDAPKPDQYDALVLAVGHDEFRRLGPAELRNWGKPQAHVLYDLKGLLAKEDSDLRL
jgi:UDP-N-acetyl-D-galactosamine dehydrogenase